MESQQTALKHRQIHIKIRKKSISARFVAKTKSLDDDYMAILALQWSIQVKFDGEV